ncbi:MAG: glycosyltransferase [bacterium]|nr:glycosyltransferase [bacterium]
MKILICTNYYYYGDPRIADPWFSAFTSIPRQMGHEVHFLDHYAQARINKEMFNDFFLSTIKHGGYDLVLIVLTQEEFRPEILEEAKKYTTLVGWNSDDDWRWEDYSKKWYPYFTNMITTYRHIYEAHKQNYPNLILSQWACPGFYDGSKVPKDIDFSFVGLTYGERGQQIRQINKHLPLLTFGRSTPATNLPLKKRIKRTIANLCRIPYEDNALSGPKEVNGTWNRSKITFTPLRASHGPGLQIKGRVFEMGLSGTVMLCDLNPALDEFYTRNQEYMDYTSLEECIEKARWLLAHETERQKISTAYYDRTRKEHLWEHRFKKIFADLNLPQ